MTKKNNSVKPADTVAVVAVAIVLGLSYWVFLPQLKNLQAHRVAAQQQAATATQLQQRYNTLVGLTDSLPNARQQLDLLTIAYPSGQHTAEAMIQLQAMAAKSGVAIVSLVPSQARAGTLSITGSFKGSYPAYLTFMKELSNNVRPVALRSLTLTTESESQRSTLNANITVDFPYAITAEEAAGTQEGL